MTQLQNECQAFVVYNKNLLSTLRRCLGLLVFCAPPKKNIYKEIKVCLL